LLKIPATPRNTARSVVPVRLGDSERGQIGSAADRLGKTLSAFIREAALQASAVVERKAAVHSVLNKPAPEPEEREPVGVVMIDPEPTTHVVDGLLIDAKGNIVGDADWR
jgi:hypothetical protein